MRQIKFRGITVPSELNNFKEGYVFGNYSNDPSPNITWYNEQNELDCSEVNVSTVEQFTGLKDIYLNDIYEGDLCNFKGHVCQVVYRENYCDFVFNIEKYGQRLLNVTKANIKKYQCEVIGNIWDKLIFKKKD